MVTSQKKLDHACDEFSGFCNKTILTKMLLSPLKVFDSLLVFVPLEVG